jgi:hypothetical protein
VNICLVSTVDDARLLLSETPRKDLATECRRHADLCARQQDMWVGLGLTRYAEEARAARDRWLDRAAAIEAAEGESA